MKMRPVTLTLAAAVALGAMPQAGFAQTGGTPLSNFFACQASGQRQETGALLGGVAGALLGSQVSKNERALGAVLGAGLGAVAGSWIGCRMQVSEQQRARAAFEAALNTNQTQTWSDSVAGSSGRVEVIQTNVGGGGGAPSFGQATSAANLSYAGQVQPLRTSFEPTNAQYYAPGAVNLRANPSTTGAVVGRLSAGQTFNVAGRVAGGQWLLVEQNGRITGYVADWVVQPAGGGYSNADCKIVQQTIQTRAAQPQVERYTACRDSGGGWVLSAA